MPFLAIVGMTVVSCVLYGIVHDQVTVRICLEYFTIGHPPIFETTSPTLLALGWGVVATWWFGLILGVPLALAARVGRWPKRGPGPLVRPIAVLMAACAVAAALSGFVGYLLARSGSVRLLEPLASRVPEDRHVPFLTDLRAHSASYLAGFVGGIVLIGIVLVGRARRARRAAAGG